MQQQGTKLPLIRDPYCLRPLSSTPCSHLHQQPPLLLLHEHYSGGTSLVGGDLGVGLKEHLCEQLPLCLLGSPQDQVGLRGPMRP